MSVSSTGTGVTILPPRDDSSEQRLADLALALFEPVAVEDLLDAAPDAIRACLGIDAEVVLLLGAEDFTPPAEQRAWAMPLAVDGEMLGAIVVNPHRDDADRQRDLRQEVRVASLVAAAIASRRRILDEHQHARAATAELKLDLVATLSHEMRTPLASIKGFASALTLDGVDWDEPTRWEFLRAIDDECDHLNQLIADILDSAVIEAGALRIEREPVLLPRIVERVVQRFSVRSDKFRFVTMFPNDFPIVEADARRIEQVLANLVDNAVKYSPGGELIVARGEALADEVRVDVVDQGIGIAPEHLNKLFERFFRARRHPAVGGTGLGLPISDAIVRAHGGRIWAESAVGVGTTLSFTLPRSRELEEDERDDG